MRTFLVALGVAVVAGGCSSVAVTGAPAGTAVAPSPVGPTSDLCTALTYAAPAASRLLRSQPAFSGAFIQPGTSLPGTTGELRCLAANSSSGVTADACIDLLQGVDVSVYDAKTSLAVTEGSLAATHPLAQQLEGDRYHVQLDLGGFATRAGSDVLENGSDSACASDAAVAAKILDQVLSYYRPAPIS